MKNIEIRVYEIKKCRFENVERLSIEKIIIDTGHQTFMLLKILIPGIGEELKLHQDGYEKRNPSHFSRSQKYVV